MGYSVAIRTLGKAGEKYDKLLKSIERSVRKPDRVIVVLPTGYPIPSSKLGYEQYVFCEKSMIRQRIEALNYIDSEYTLFLDDDIEFDPDFVDKILKPLETNLYDCSTGPLFSFFPTSLAGKIAGTLTASVSISVFRRDMYVKILRSGGWSYHTFDTSIEHYYPTESFAWTCFAIRTEVMRAIHMEDEVVWLERFGYASGDDRVMAYKLIKNGYKACVVGNAPYVHNDAKSSTSKEEMHSDLPKFCMYYMHTVFWHRFIQDPETEAFRRLQNSLCFSYWKVMSTGYHLAKILLKKDDGRKYRAFLSGIREGQRYVKSPEYSLLKPMRRV